MTTAQSLYDDAFHIARDPRSNEYKAGVFAAIQNRLENFLSVCPFGPGTAQADAYHAGWDEGAAHVKAFRNGSAA